MCKMSLVEGLAATCDNCHDTVLSVRICFKHDTQLCTECARAGRTCMKTLEELESSVGVVQEVEDLREARNDLGYYGRENAAAESLGRALENFCSANSFTSVAAWARLSDRRAEVLS